jgi:hypothetical protein
MMWRMSENEQITMHMMNPIPTKTTMLFPAILTLLKGKENERNKQNNSKQLLLPYQADILRLLLVQNQKETVNIPTLKKPTKKN